MNIAHISDLHAGGSWFDAAAFEAGVALVNDLGVDQVVFTGDLTDHSLHEEFERAAALLDRFDAPVHAVPGNHDAMRDGWRLFADRLMGGRRYRTADLGAAVFVGLDSSEPDSNEGHIGREQMEWFEEVLESGAGRPHVVALHHHVLPVPHTGRERNILLDSGEFLRVLDDHKVPLVLTGHKHQPWCWRVNGTVVATTGTFSSRKTNCGQNFNHVEAEDGRLVVTNVDVKNGARRRLYEGPWPAAQVAGHPAGLAGPAASLRA